MATRKSLRLNGPPAKSRRVDDQPNAVAVAVAVDEPTPPIFKLNDDCCFALFDFLPRRSLNSFGQTCKWAQRVAVDFYRMKHSASTCSVHLLNPDVFDLENAQKLSIFQDSLKPYQHVKEFCNCNQSTKQITLAGTTLSIAKVKCLKKVLQRVERVTLHKCKLNGDFYDKFLKFCPSLKVLCIHNRNPNEDYVLFGANNGWLTRKYPTLERLELWYGNASQIDELKIFFEQNPNVRCFAINSKFLSANWGLFKSKHIKLNVLAIRFDSDNAVEYRNELNSLHERGVFQRLHWYSYEEIPYEVASSKGLEKLAAWFFNVHDSETITPLLDSLKELIIRNICGDSHEAIARDLVNLERIHIGVPTSEAIASFIRHAANLKRIKISCGYGIETSGLNLAAWNKQRLELSGAQKVTIYVPEYVYLATKWATDRTEYSLISLQRADSYDWVNDFSY